MRPLSKKLVNERDALVRRWSQALRESAHPRLELSAGQLEQKIPLQLRAIGAWLDEICALKSQKPETIWDFPERLDPESRVRQDVPLEEVVLQYGLLAKTVLESSENEPVPDYSLSEVSHFFQALTALIAESARRYTAFREARQIEDRARYLTRLTHQMRTPLTVLKLNVSSLSGSHPLDERIVHSMERNVKRLTALVDGVMRLERFKPEEIPVLPIELSPAKLIDQVVDDNAHDAERKALRVEVLVNRLLRMRIDPALFIDALGNLVHNAIKYTESGQVRVEVEERALDVVFKVQDTGPGIARDRQIRMFEMVDPDTAGGAGIGLTIVHRATTAQGGTVGVESEPGKGSLFWFALPRTVKDRNST